MGEVRKRGRVWWVRYSRNGRRYEESSGSKKKKAAIDLLRIREGDGAHGLPVTPQIARLRFDDAVADVITDYRTNRKRSLDSVQRRVEKHLLPVFTGCRMASLTTADLRTYIAKRQAETVVIHKAHDVPRKDGTTRRVPEQRRAITGAANASINRELAIIRRAFRLARQAGTLLHVPHIPMLREDNVRAGFFERDQFEDVRSALPEALRGVATFAYFSGWRIASEVLTLQWSGVNRTAKTVRLEPGRTKNAEGRTLPYGLLPELCAVIDDQWQAHERLKASDRLVSHVFHRDGAPIRSLRKAWSTACEHAGVPGKIPHDFRRTAVRNLVRAGVPEKTAMGITGHKTRSVFDRYDIVNEADLRDAIGKLAGATGTKKGQSARSGRVTRLKRSA